jgi:hypothetical protein
VSTATDPEDSFNRSLDDAIELLEREVERLRASLEVYRQLEHPQRADIIRWHIKTLDRRQDALEQLRAMLLARQTPGDPLH